MFHVIVNANSLVQHVIQIMSFKSCNSNHGIIKHVYVNVKTIVHAKKIISWNPSTCLCENNNYLKSIADNSVIEYDEIIFVWILNQLKRQIL